MNSSPLFETPFCDRPSTYTSHDSDLKKQANPNNLAGINLSNAGYSIGPSLLPLIMRARKRQLRTARGNQ